VLGTENVSALAPASRKGVSPTVNVTGSDWSLPPGPLIEIDAAYVPGLNFMGSTATNKYPFVLPSTVCPGVVVWPVASVNQLVELVARKPVFACAEPTLTTWGGGAAVPV